MTGIPERFAEALRHFPQFATLEEEQLQRGRLFVAEFRKAARNCSPVRRAEIWSSRPVAPCKVFFNRSISVPP
jgi:hypothetical protein